MSLELWGGFECTVNRLGNSYFDQNVRTGHHDRPHDLDLVAALGITRLRYPVLWERTERDGRHGLEVERRASEALARTGH